MHRYQPLATAVLMTVWTLVMVPLFLVIAYQDGVSLVSIVTVVLATILVALTIYAVPALMGGKM